MAHANTLSVKMGRWWVVKGGSRDGLVRPTGRVVIWGQGTRRHGGRGAQRWGAPGNGQCESGGRESRETWNGGGRRGDGGARCGEGTMQKAEGRSRRGIYGG